MRLHQRFAGDGLEVVYIGAFETEEACRAWKEEYSPRVPGDLGRRRSTVPRASRTAGFHGAFSSGRTARSSSPRTSSTSRASPIAIQRMYERPAVARTTSPRAVGTGRCTVVLGGGTGGLVAARELRRRLPASHRIVLVDRSAEHVYQPSLLWQMVGERRPSQFTRPLARLEQEGHRVPQRARSRRSTSTSRVVVTTSGDVDYDSLVVSLGAQLAPETVPRVRAGWPTTSTPRRVATGSTPRSRISRTVSSGSSFPPCRTSARRRRTRLRSSRSRSSAGRGFAGTSRSTSSRPSTRPCPWRPPRSATRSPTCWPRVASTTTRCSRSRSCGPTRARSSPLTGAHIEVDLLMVVPPHQAPEVVRSSPLLGVSGFIHVDARTLQTGYDNVYAIGDVTTIKLPDGKALPKAGVFAHAEAKVVAQRIADEASGKRSDAEFDRQRLLLDRAGRRQGRVRRRQLLCRARTPGQAETTRTSTALGEGGLREVVASPLALAVLPTDVVNAADRRPASE